MQPRNLCNFLGGTKVNIPDNAQMRIRKMRYYIDTMVDVCKGFRLKGTENWKYSCYEEIVQQFGQFFIPPHIIALINADEDSRFLTALNGLRSGIIYCEGYVLLKEGKPPVDHAWLYNQKSKKVIDFTYGLTAELYFGIPFSTNFVQSRANETKCASIFNTDLETSSPILRDGLPQGALISLDDT